MVDAGELRALLDDRPELDGDVERLLAADEPFEFADVDVDSGAFGELVAAGVAVADDDGDGYRVADRGGVRRALDGEVAAASTDTDSTADHSAAGSSETRAGAGSPRRAAGWLPAAPDPRALGALVVALAVLAVVRIVVTAGAVFRDGRVVLSSNDPYYYRYWVETLLADPSLSPSTLPAEVAMGEPLFVSVAWLGSLLAGGTPAAAGHVLAWYPVVATVVAGALVYVLSVRLTDDRRVGLAAVAVLAVVPHHAARTSVGYGDHHAFDYVLLALAVLGFASLVRAGERTAWTVETARRPGPVVAAAALAVGVAGQVLAWDAGPLLVAPLGVAVLGLSLVWLRDDRDPLRAGAPILAALGAAAAITWGVHATLGWHTALVAGTPALALAGSGAAFGLAAACRRRGIDPVRTAAIQGGVGLAGIAALAIAAPTAWATVGDRVGTQLLRADAIGETRGLFGTSLDWLYLFGLLAVAVPAVAWSLRRSLDEERWLVPACYFLAFLGLAALQIRFLGQFAIVAAPFAGLAIVHLVARIADGRAPAPIDPAVDGGRLPRPDGAQLATVATVFLLVCGLGVLLVPSAAGNTVITDDEYAVATWLADDAAAADGSNVLRPIDAAGSGGSDQYVFSTWDRNRLYNYAVDGDARSYGYARDNYGAFVTSTNGSAWYERLENRTTAVVTGPETPTTGGTVGASLYDAFGSRTENASGLSHYRAVYATADASHVVFDLVPGATIRGTDRASNETIELSTTVRLPGSAADSADGSDGSDGEVTGVGDDPRVFEYVRRVETNATGGYSITVAQPGEYDVGSSGAATVSVTETDVGSGSVVAVA